MNGIGRKAATLCATTAVGVTMFASVALAVTTAPVLPVAPVASVVSTIPAGLTSYPGMTGDCTTCHTYDTTTPAPAPVTP